jgi:hypothetical protein
LMINVVPSWLSEEISPIVEALGILCDRPLNASVCR